MELINIVNVKPEIDSSFLEAEEPETAAAAQEPRPGSPRSPQIS